MTDYSGNLALQRKRSAASIRIVQKQQPQARPMAIKTKRIPVSATPAVEATNQAKVRKIRRALAIQRLKMLAGMAAMIFLVTGIFSLVVYRQAKILELNFQNVATERQITKIEQDNGQISEALALKTNLDLIRQQAIEKLGLQDPGGSQLVQVSMPQTDRVVFSSLVNDSPDNEAYLASVFINIEGYFKSMNQQRQGD